jgi:hypothetical protein
MDNTVNCACLIHGDVYEWQYVEKLYSMLKRNISYPVRLHVFTEPERPVPAEFVKHDLTIWDGVSGPKKSWWYKVQMFDRKHFAGKLLYFDLDVVITGNLDWILACNPQYLWAIRDFKHLWRPQWNGINSSMMYWDTMQYHRVWKNFSKGDIKEIMRRFPGDQDYISNTVDFKQFRFFDPQKIVSWRWQAKDGGMSFEGSRHYARPDAGTVLPQGCNVMIFHGSPKPHQVNDPIINGYWV